MPTTPETRARQRSQRKELDRLKRERQARLEAWRAASDDRERERKAFMPKAKDPALAASFTGREAAWNHNWTNAEIDAAIERWLKAAERAESDEARHVMVGVYRIAPFADDEWTPPFPDLPVRWEQFAAQQRWWALVNVAGDEASGIADGPPPTTIPEIIANARRRADAVYAAHGLPSGHTGYRIRDEDELTRPNDWTPAKEAFLGDPPSFADGYRFNATPSEVGWRSGAREGETIWLAATVHHRAEELGQKSRYVLASLDTIAFAAMGLQRALFDLEMATRPRRRLDGMSVTEAIQNQEQAIEHRKGIGARGGARRAQQLRRAGEPVRAKATEVIGALGNADISLNPCTELVHDAFPDKSAATIRDIIKPLFEWRADLGQYRPRRRDR